jgi:hypothetical protein
MKTLLMLFIHLCYFSDNNDCQNYIKEELLPLQFAGEVVSKEIRKDNTLVITIKNETGGSQEYTFNLMQIDDSGFAKKLEKGNWAIKKKCEQAFKIAIINTSQSADIFTYPVKCR